ncbi:hypothetical protein ABIH81_06790 [Micromonospora sp. HUAS YX12]|uniref:PEP-CTERM sorting domain-containing protein n=1 Tax=Micromonospora sp. HUAS YX12 TaxID=3156396 RepID=A0AAU7R434_9ACTN
MINELSSAALDGIVENLPTALIMAGLAAAATMFARRRRSRSRIRSRNAERGGDDAA